MTYIVHPDLLRSGVVTAILHLSADPASVIREDAVCRLYIVELYQIVFQTVFQYLRYDNLTITSFRLRRIDIVLALLLTKVTKPAAERRKRVSINYRNFGGDAYKKTISAKPKHY